MVVFVLDLQNNFKEVIGYEMAETGNELLWLVIMGKLHFSLIL